MLIAGQHDRSHEAGKVIAVHGGGTIRVVLTAMVLCVLCAAPVLAGEPTIEWDKQLGGSGYDMAYSLEPTDDGGYILLGKSESSASGDVAETNNGENDFWLVKLNAAGAVQWETLLGGRDDDFGRSVQQTDDGGYILVGYSDSSLTGDVGYWNYGGNTFDIWVVKLSSIGAIAWQRLLGGGSNENGYSVDRTADGGYIILGTSGSGPSEDITSPARGDWDFWVVKLNATGGIEWEKRLGGTNVDQGYSIQQTADGGYIMVGGSYSSVTGDVWYFNHGGTQDAWVVKLSGTGSIEWQRLLGGGGDDSAYSVRQTADGGYIFIGGSDSGTTGDITGTYHGMADLWVVKLNATGTVQWQRQLGGDGNDAGTSVVQTGDGGYVLLGASNSSQSGDVVGTNHGNWDSNGRVMTYDCWAVRLDADGVLLWEELLGGVNGETGESIRQTADGGYILAGSSETPSTSGDVTGINHGLYDFWVVKLSPETPLVTMLPGAFGLPTSIAVAGLYDDVNGNARMDFADVVLYFNQMSWIARAEPTEAFDYNRNRRIDFADVVWLFANL